jgi:hypothetical protein
VTARLISALLIVFLAASCAKQATFEENYDTAKANAATQSGTAYDNAVGTAVAVPGFALAQRTCVVNNPGVVSLHGYMRIKSPSDYSVVLEPKGPLADCIESTITNRTLPAPPTTPYLNPVEFAATQ